MLRCSATRAMTRTLHEPWPRPKRPPVSPGSAESIRRAPKKPQSQSAGNRMIGRGLLQLDAEVLEELREVHRLDLSLTPELVVYLRDGANACPCILKRGPHRRIRCRPGLKPEQAGHQGQAVLHPMADLAHEDGLLLTPLAQSRPAPTLVRAIGKPLSGGHARARLVPD